MSHAETIEAFVSGYGASSCNAEPCARLSIKSLTGGRMEDTMEDT